MGRLRLLKKREFYIMTKKRIPKGESENYAGQPQPTPMPTRMPVQDASSFARSQRPNGEAPKVIAMDDYPAGHGGMRMMPMSPAEQPAQPTVRPSAPIGARPPATKMPTNL